MNRLLDAIDVLIDRLRDMTIALITLIYGGFWLVAFGLAAVAAPLLFLGRSGYYLVYGEWIWSYCDVLRRFKVYSLDTCELRTGFLGLDRIGTYAVSESDASLGLLLAAGVLAGVPFVFFLVRAAF